ncbi:hypothetical protein ACWGK6_15505 [Streptomyces violaceusniger]
MRFPAASVLTRARFRLGLHAGPSWVLRLEQFAAGADRIDYIAAAPPACTV